MNTKVAGRRATTLPELIISLTVTALVALGVASMLQAASYGTSSRREVRRVAVRAQEVRARLDSAIRSARAVLACEDGRLVLWTGDSRTDGHVNLSELQLIEVPAGSSRLTSYATRFPAGWTQAQIDAADASYAPTADFAGICRAAKTSGNFPGTLWTDEASGLSFTLDRSAVQQARLVSWSVTLTHELISQPVAGASALRAWAAPQ